MTIIDKVPVGYDPNINFYIPLQPAPAPPPALKWAGGKRWLVPHIESLWQPHRFRRLVEPFCGGLAIALGLAASTALLNDINPHLINFYQQIKLGFVIRIEMRNDKDLFYANRSKFNHLIKMNEINSQQAASLFYYLNRTGYNGLCRFNQKGEFNVPFGKYKTINYETDFSVYKDFFKNWTFQSKDFEEIDLRSSDFIYADPPYDVEFVQYSKEGFTWDDQVRLAQWLKKHPGPVAISNQATDRIIDLYKNLGFSLKFLDAPRRISSNGDRTPAKEVLATKGINNAQKYDHGSGFRGNDTPRFVARRLHIHQSNNDWHEI